MVHDYLNGHLNEDTRSRGRRRRALDQVMRLCQQQYPLLLSSSSAAERRIVVKNFPKNAAAAAWDL